MKNHELVERLKCLVSEEKKLVHQVLLHLRMVDDLKLHLEQGFPSLFVFCCEELGYSEPEAHIRIQAMRLLKSMPEIESQLASGQLSLSVAARAQGAFRRGRVGEVRRREIVAALAGTSVREAERKLADFFPQAPEPDRKRILAGGEERWEFTASAKLVEKVRRLKNLLAHRNPNFSRAELLEYLVDRELGRLEESAHAAPVLGARKVKSGAIAQAGSAEDGSGDSLEPVLEKPRGQIRYVSAQLKREVKKRDQNRCQYVDPRTGRACRSEFGLEIDHVLPVALGGKRELENLQLLCDAHNRWKGARQVRGK